jgi:hypothetical protein
MYLEAVTVCVDYADYLAETIPHNFPHLDRWVIVTTEKDVKTREVCRRYNLDCVVTEEFYADNMPFNKGRGIIRGIDNLSLRDWVLHIDADVVLPTQTKHVLRTANLDPTMIYGVDRIRVLGYEKWQALQASKWLYHQHDYQCRVNFPDGYPVGTRWANDLYGYVPIGFFQLWHSTSDLWRGFHSKPYPYWHNTAARGDVQHAVQWDRRKRSLVPELIVAHLEAETAPLGANWKGRTTPTFGPGALHGIKAPMVSSGKRPEEPGFEMEKMAQGSGVS